MNTELRRITRRSALAGMAGATVAAVTALPATAMTPQPEHLTPDEREVLDLYRRTPGTGRRHGDGRATLKRVMKVFAETEGDWS